MCLTIPKKVIGISGQEITVEEYDGRRQVVKSVVKLELGDYCLTQQNVVFERIDKSRAESILKMLEK